MPLVFFDVLVLVYFCEPAPIQVFALPVSIKRVSEILSVVVMLESLSSLTVNRWATDSNFCRVSYSSVCNAYGDSFAPSTCPCKKSYGTLSINFRKVLGP